MATTENFSEAKRRLLERLLRGEAARQIWEAPLEPRQPADPVPIAPSQQQIWLHSQMVPGVPLYNEPVTLHYRGTLDRLLLERSFHELLRRHEIWRTTFAQVDGQVVQAVHPDLAISIPLTDLTDLPEALRDREAVRIATADARRPFDLGVGPLLRARLIKLAANSYRLYLTAHHIVFEGRSMIQIVLKQLPAIYEAFSTGLPSPLPEPGLQYADYAIWQKRLLDNDTAAGQMDYWRRTLSGELPVLELPADRPRPAVLSHAGAMETFSLRPELSAALKATASAEGVTPYMLMLAAFKTLLHRYSGQEDILIGGVADVRRRTQFEELAGFFLHTVALRTRPQGELPFREYLQQVKDAVLGAVAASDVPFDHVIREVQPKRDLSPARPAASGIFHGAAGILAAPGLGADHHGRFDRRVEIRSVPGTRRTPARHRRSLPLRHGPLRSSHHPADDRPLDDASGRNCGEPRLDAFRASVADRGRNPPGDRNLEHHGAARAARHHP